MRASARWGGTLGLAVGLGSLVAHAAPAAPAVAKAGGGQAALAVGFDAQGELRAAVCAQAPCGEIGRAHV